VLRLARRAVSAAAVSVRERFVEESALLAGRAEMDERGPVRGLDRHHGPQRGNRLVEPPLRAVDDPDVRESVEVPGIALDHLSEALERFLEVPQLAIRVRQVVVDLGRARVEPRRTLKMRDRLLVAAEVHQSASEVEQGPRRAGLTLERAGEHGERLVVARLLHQRDRKEVVREDVLVRRPRSKRALLFVRLVVCARGAFI
jgi:hypothetical protein